MDSLEAQLAAARDLDEAELADAIEQIGFECTRCGMCCKGLGDEDHTATVFPDEVRTLQDASDYDFRDVTDATTSPSQDSRDFRDVARPMPFGLDPEGTGVTFEWALQTDACGDCTFYTEDEGGTGACTVHTDRPLICETYPFSVALASGATDSTTAESDRNQDSLSQPMGGVVDTVGNVRAHECEGLGSDIDRDHAKDLASALKECAIRELEEAIGVRDNYRPVDTDTETVVYDSEGPKHPDGTPIEHPTGADE